ncbi:MAG: hypothetical protein QNL52_03360, partial [Synechococcus sp. ChBW.bin.23]
KTVVGGGNPLTELLPAVGAGALLDGGSHEYGKEGLERDGYGRAGRPAKRIVKQVCGLCSSFKDEHLLLLHGKSSFKRATSERLKI